MWQRDATNFNFFVGHFAQQELAAAVGDLEMHVGDGFDISFVGLIKATVAWLLSASVFLLSSMHAFNETEELASGRLTLRGLPFAPTQV